MLACWLAGLLVSFVTLHSLVCVCIAFPRLTFSARLYCTHSLAHSSAVTLRIDWPALQGYGQPKSGSGGATIGGGGSVSGGNGNTGMVYEPIPTSCLHLISCLLKDNSRERLGYHGAQTVMDHPYFTGVPFETLCSTQPGECKVK